MEKAGGTLFAISLRGNPSKKRSDMSAIIVLMAIIVGVSFICDRDSGWKALIGCVIVLALYVYLIRAGKRESGQQRR
jgi:hypothetical protein